MIDYHLVVLRIIEDCSYTQGSMRSYTQGSMYSYTHSSTYSYTHGSTHHCDHCTISLRYIVDCVQFIQQITTDG